MEIHTIVNKTVTIHAPTPTVWQALTDPTVMPQWMAESELLIDTDWTVGSPILIRGELHHLPFENKGTVLQFVSQQLLQYTHLSSLSALPDQPESYSIVTFQLASIETRTALTVTVANFPTEVIYKHLAFYWPVALGSLKRLIENQTRRLAQGCCIGQSIGGDRPHRPFCRGGHPAGSGDAPGG